MNCLNCDNTGYRRLCNYDNETYTCTNNQQYSFDCVTTGYKNNKQCVPLPIGQGRYKTMGECQQSCDIQPPVGEISYQCADIGYGKDKGGKECILMYNRPDIEQGRFSTMGECQRSCAIPVTPITPITPIPSPPGPVGQKSYQCVGMGYGGNSSKQCVEMNAPPGQGRFSTMGECQRSCPIPVTPVISDMVGVQRRGVQRMH